MAKLITVRSTIPPKPDGGNVVALYETDTEHPDGEAYVAGPAPVRVARTPQVHRLIADGVLAETDEDEAPAPPPATTAPPPNGGEDRHPGDGSDEVIPGVTVAQRDALVAAGFETVEDIRNATDEQLDAVPGIGPDTVKRLREATKE